MGIIYKITNLENNKIYIGQTTKPFEERWKQHWQVAYNKNSKDYNSYFKKALRKYPHKEQWKTEIIDNADTIEELKEKEIYWIKYYNSFAFEDKGWGYNSTRGGDGVSGNGKNVSSFDIITGVKIKTYNSLAEAEKDIGCRIEEIGKVNTSSAGLCWLYTEDIKKLTEQELIEKIHSLYPYLVYQLDLNGNFIQLYRNTKEAAENIQCSQGNLIETCLGKRRKCKEYQWFYQKDIKKHLNKPVRDLNPLGESVTQYGMDGKKIKEWPNIITAAKELGLNDAHICSCCRGNRQSCGQYQWRYTEENIEKLDELFVKRKVICIETKDIFDTANHAAKFFHYSQQTIKKNCMGQLIKKPYHFAWYDE